MVDQDYVEFQAAVLRALPREIYPFHMRDWMKNDKLLAEVLRRELINEAIFKETRNYPIRVDYDLSIEAAVRAGGYDEIKLWRDPIPHTWATGQREVCVELAYVPRIGWNKELLRLIDKIGYRPADPHEFLAFGAKYPDVQREVCIAALGSPLPRTPNRCVSHEQVLLYLYGGLMLYGNDSKRILSFKWQDGWGGGCEFAVVRKER